MVEQIIEHKSPQLYAIAGSSYQYERYKGILDGGLKHGLTVELLNEVFGNQSIAACSTEDPKSRIFLIHDISDIRKPETQKSEHLGKVRSLDDKIINGYQVMASVVVNPETKDLRLFQLTPFSNRDPQFVGQETLKVESRTLAEGEYNQSSLIRDHLAQAHQSFENQNITHILDRGFDDLALLEFTENLGDDFVVRLKSNRKSAPTERKREPLETQLLTKTFRSSARARLDRYSHKNKPYPNAQLLLEWEFWDANNGQPLWVVRVQIFDQNGKPIFKQPWILVTNIEVRNEFLARQIFQFYSMRSRIELVFKFLKDELKWETFRQADYQAIQTLITLVFFMGGYFFELQPALVQNPTFRFICDLAKCKKRYTRHFFLKGLVMIANYLEISAEIEQMTVEEKNDFFQIIKQFFPSKFNNT
jgi:hypothetical protein